MLESGTDPESYITEYTFYTKINTRPVVCHLQRPRFKPEWPEPEAGSHLRLIDFVYHSTLGLRVIKQRRRRKSGLNPTP